MDKDTSEIAKLTERISKDPKSKLFVPLAEEYKKAGDIEMSIHVLMEGLKNNPGYVTARSFLGRLLIEKGDLPGAQKEFEEVVKVIPDNLMAQRKLGDLYALQDRPADAVMHYKTALSLNPKDTETAMLIAESEAGHDIKKYLFKPKPASTEKPQKKQDSAPALSLNSAAIPRQHPATISAKQPEPAEEEPEEILIVEPLEPESPAGLYGESTARNLDFLAETVQEPVVEEREEQKGDVLFALDGPFATQEAAVPEFDDSLLKMDAPQGTGAELSGEPEKQADDFTTDTLAELYISQGFFEKAVDIYERMLVDNPDSQGLKNKLANVRAMAASTAPDEKSEKETASIAIPTDFTPETEFVETHAAENASEFDAFVMPPVPGAAQPRLDDWELPATEVIPVLDQEAPPPAKASKQPQHFDVGFEPVEYVPPDAVPRRKAGTDIDEASVVREPGTSGPARRNPPAAGKKETVERLESWLKKIMKET